MTAPTLVFIRAHYVDGRLRFHPGDEVPLGMFLKEALDQALDHGYVAEATERPSLYRLFHRFTGCKPEQPLTKEEIAAQTAEE